MNFNSHLLYQSRPTLSSFLLERIDIIWLLSEKEEILIKLEFIAVQIYMVNQSYNL